MNGTAHELGERLNSILRESGQPELGATDAERFGEYGALLVRWNGRMNLTAIRDEDGILRRHFAECVRAARALPAGIDTLLDFGSGAGFPGIPVAICRPELAVTLAESHIKKAAFLREVLRTLGLNATVHAGRAEASKSQFGCVTLRAVDKMDAAVQAAAPLVKPGGWLAILTTVEDGARWQWAANSFTWQEPIEIGGDRRVLMLGRSQQ